jgi:uncharacterized protein (DUF934 family)
MKLIPAAQFTPATDAPGLLRLANDADPLNVDLTDVHTIELHFPKFIDGRAHSQAYLLSRRRGFRGTLRAVGDVLVDQVVQLQRNGFTEAVLRADQSLAAAERQYQRFGAFYQGDASDTRPRFARAA